MRKISVLVIFAALIFSPLTAISAFKDNTPQTQVQGGFSGPVSGAMADTVAKALELSDDQPVVLTGNIVSRIAGKKNKYIFKDQTGEIRVEIDRKAFRGQDVTPEDTVRLLGKVDKDWGDDMKIEVKELQLLKH